MNIIFVTVDLVGQDRLTTILTVSNIAYQSLGVLGR